MQNKATMMLRKTGFVLLMLIGLSTFAALIPSPVKAAGGCGTGATAPCAEDPAIKYCNACHTIQIQGGNRNGTDRFITLNSATFRHILDPKQADWTSTVNAMITKGADPSAINTVPGYLNMNYCSTCTGVILSGPAVVNIKDTSATITWSTSLSGWEDGPADSVVFYGTSATALTSQASDSTMTGTHAVTLTGLKASTKYYFQYQSTGADGKTVKYSFDTPSFRTVNCLSCGGGTTTATFAYVLDENSGTISVVNVDKGSLQTTIFLNETPFGIAASPDGKTVYASAYATSADLFVIDTATNTIKNTVPGFAPNGSGVQVRLAISPDGLYLFGLQWPNMLYTFSTANLSIIKSTTLSQCYLAGCADLAVSGDGKEIYVVAGSYDSTTLMIDAASAENPSGATTVTPITLPGYSPYGPGANAVAAGPDGRAWIPGLYSTGGSGGGFSMVQPTGTATAVAGLYGSPSVVVTADGSAVYTPQINSNYDFIVAVLDTATLKVTKSATGLFGIYQPTGSGISADGSKLFVAAYCGAATTCPDLLYIVDTTTLSVLNSVAIGSGYTHKMAVATVTTTTAPAVPPTLIYSANGAANNVSVIDPATNTITATVAVGSNPQAVAPSPDAKLVYAVNSDSTVSVITRATQTVTATITLPDPTTGSMSAIVGPGSNVLYVANHDAMKIYVINTSNNTITATIPLGQNISGEIYGPLDLAITPDGGSLYAVVDAPQGWPAAANGYIAVIQTSNNSVVANILLPLMSGSVHVGGQHIAMNPLGGYAYVAANGTIQILDTIANGVVTSSKPALDPTGSGTCYQYNAVAVLPDGTAVALSCWSSVTLFDTSTLQPTGNSGLNISDVVGSIAFNADGSKAYLSSQTTGVAHVNVMDMTTLAFVITITTPSQPMMVASSPAVRSITGGTPISLTAPDLTITSISANSPVNLSVLNNISITDTVANIGGYKSGSFVINYYFSPTNTFNSATAVYIGSRSIAGPFNAAAINTATSTFTVSPTTVAAGNYYVFAFADANQQIAEANEDNNKTPTSGTESVIVADLIETAVTSTAIGTTVLPGATISITDTVKNQGSGPSGPFYIGYYLMPTGAGKPNFLGTRSISSLAAGASSTATVSLKIPSGAYGGPFYLQANADYTNTVPESIENNNTFTNTSGIITISPPDLIITATSFTPSSLTRPATLSITFTVKNQGPSAASSFRVGLYLSTDNVITTADKLIGSSNTYNSLAAGASLTATVSITVGTSIAAGTYYVGAYADYLNTTPESNETNNGLAASGTLAVH
ncbi:MAG: fibronectin type III domain-containing protein [Nitrospirae bacterium]|nr:fibronectin type III domain-containing protein [Nitrospirota bacterium]